MTTRITTTLENGVARIVLNDGKVNAMSPEMLTDLLAALDEAEQAGALVVLEGRPGMFSAGFDLKVFQRGPEASAQMIRLGVNVIERVLGFPRPVITVCTGHAYPMGAFIMLSADRRLGVEGTFRIGMNETAIGLTVPWFAVELARHRLSPQGFALVNTGHLADPPEALRLGYLDRLAPPESIAEIIEEEIARLLKLDQPSFTNTKQRINQQALEAIHAAANSELGAVNA